MTASRTGNAAASPTWIYLASQSPRRRELLAQIGVAHTLLLAGDDEDVEALEAECPGETPRDYVERVTRAKLDAALARRERRSLAPAPVLCSDTTVALGARLLGKPRDAADARATLEALAGRDHEVLTGVAVGWGGRVGWRLSVSRVWFTPLDAARIERYIAMGEPFGKAGAYGIQGRAAAWIARVDGSGSGIMGLPLHETAELLRAAGMAI